MLQFSDTPYQFYPPKPNSLYIAFFRWWNRSFFLPGPENKVREVCLSISSGFRKAFSNTPHRILLLPNHSTHSDPAILLEVQRQLKLTSLFMAAYEGFQQNKLRGWVMQKCGAFSVDREGSDSLALKQAVRTLVEGKYALTIFPEGNVYLMNDKVTPFLEGAAFIAMKAQKELGQDVPVLAVPVSIKATHLFDQTEKIRERIDALLQTVDISEIGNESVLELLKKCGIAILRKNLKQRGYSFPETGDNLKMLLNKTAEAIVLKLEEKMDISSDEKVPLMERVRKVRRIIHQIRTDQEKEIEHAVASLWADEAIFALRILSYTGTYLDENPSLDRFAETTEKMIEDLNSKIQPPCGDRVVFAKVMPPINLSSYLEGYKKNSRQILKELTNSFENEVQRGIDEINQNNPYPGSKSLLIETAFSFIKK